MEPGMAVKSLQDTPPAMLTGSTETLLHSSPET
jgi:hypothetical protein